MSTARTEPLDPPSYEWWIDDRGNPWVKHQCLDRYPEAWRLPPPWKVDGDRITPSLDCQRCGLHIFIGPAEHVARLWNWEIHEDRLCGSCDGKTAPVPECEWCHGTGIDDVELPVVDAGSTPSDEIDRLRAEVDRLRTENSAQTEALTVFYEYADAITAGADEQQGDGRWRSSKAVDALFRLAEKVGNERRRVAGEPQP